MKKTKTFYDKIRMSLEVFIRAVFFCFVSGIVFHCFYRSKNVGGAGGREKSA